MTSASPVLEIRDLNFSYNGKSILRDVNLTINQLDSTCVVGPNGGGKSTLIKLMLGLLSPETGSVSLLGMAPAEGRSRVGYVPQYANFDPLFPVTVMEVALMGRLGTAWGGAYSKIDKARAMEALAEMEMVECATSRFSELSGGQQQRVLIARALASAADMLILDEPTSNVDAHVEFSLLGRLQKLNSTMAIILVTHDLGFTSQFFKSVVCVNRDVHIHPTSAITGQVIQKLYGGDIQMIRHDHRCTEEGHVHG